jgi:hypothetical protein
MNAFLPFKAEAAPLMVAYGMGVDSTAMLVGLHQRGLRPDAILFADTGSEKPETYAYLPIIQAWLASVDFPPVVVVKRKPCEGKNGYYETIEQNVIVNSTLPSLAFAGRACSVKWKHEPQERWARQWAPARRAWATGQKVRKMIGYDDGPADRRRPNIENDKHYEYEYPLRSWGWDRDECKRQIAGAGLPVPGKSACYFCPSAKPCELLDGMCPEQLRKIIEIEAGAEPRLRKVEGLWRRAVKGFRGATKKPGRMSEFIVGEELLPEFEGQTLVDPWWKKDGPQQPTNETFRSAQAFRVTQEATQ